MGVATADVCAKIVISVATGDASKMPVSENMCSSLNYLLQRNVLEIKKDVLKLTRRGEQLYEQGRKKE